MEKLNYVLLDMFKEKLPNVILKDPDNLYFKESSIEMDSELENIRPAKDRLREIFDKKGECFSNTIGVHPDFKDLGEGVINQYICSMFLDISGSTKLGLKFPLQTVRFYKNAILRSAIEIFQAFDGHIHRLQGDAVFAYFGHKNMKKSDAIINALNASSVMQAYNQYVLNDFFKNNELDPLKIRIGMDIGDDSSVLWSSYGIENITEVTSTSVHTDLAAKLQNKASANSIMLGENIYRYLDIPKEFLKVKTHIENDTIKEDKCILNIPELNTYYQMKLFEWERYLQSFSFLLKEKKMRYNSPEDFNVTCQVLKEEKPAEIYFSNSRSLAKLETVSFKLNLNGQLNFLKPKKITWRVINRGKEAEEVKGGLSFFIQEQENSYNCNLVTRYTGHHYVECSLYDSQDKLIGREYISLYVNDEEYEMKSIGIQATGVIDV